jgi:protein tyrosine/serine phosphatase
MTRKIPFEAIENFRDFGDYAAGQKRIRKRLLFRSAHQAEATEADLAAMRDLGISLILDLRRPNERERMPSRRWQGFAGTVIENDQGGEGEDPWHLFLKQSDLSVESMRDYMRIYYDNAPHEERHIDLFRRWFETLATGPGPALVHCAAGKDRTGIVCALTHHIAGVHPDEIVEDYLLTNDPERFARRGPTFADHVEELTGRRPSPEAMIAAMGVEAEYLHAAFNAMKARHGSIDGYLETVLGVDAKRRAAIEAQILA